MSYQSTILTFTGRTVDVFNPRAEDIDIVDIAHALSNICRFTGHTRHFLSVAQHSVLVSQYCDPDDRLWGLLHDASEAYLNDMARPIKYHPDMDLYRAAEQRLMLAICERFGLPDREPVSVFEADRRLVVTEKRDLMSASRQWDDRTKQLIGNPKPLDITIEPWTHEKAETCFKEAYVSLTESLRGDGVSSVCY